MIYFCAANILLIFLNNFYKTDFLTGNKLTFSATLTLLSWSLFFFIPENIYKFAYNFISAFFLNRYKKRQIVATAF